MKAAIKPNQTRVVIGLRRSHLDVVVWHQGAGATSSRIRTRSIQWRHESSTLASENGQAELLSALKPLVAQERLHGNSICISLSGDFCVTRVITGTIDRVKREMAQLEERSSLYLSLGTGAKVLAASVRQVDARHEHALLTVVNQRVLDALVSVTTALGLKIDLIEPSLIAMSRALGHMKRDHEQPVLIVHLNERGVELGISHRGQLWLDYRPGGRAAHDEISTTVSRHLARLERYCQRYFRFTGAKIDRVFLCGSDDAISLVRSGFEQHGLAVEVLQASQIEPGWEFADPKPTSEANGALGTCLLFGEATTDSHGPNLVERLRSKTDNRWIGLAFRTLWPAAAALLVAAGIGIGDLVEKYRCGAVERQLAQCEQERLAVLQTQGEIIRADRMIQNLEVLAAQLPRPAWHQFLTTVGHCMPDDVWLDNLVVEGEDRLRLNGVSYGDDGVYEFIQWLKENPLLARIALDETGRVSLAGGPATRFGASGSLSDYAGSDENTGRKD